MKKSLILSALFLASVAVTLAASSDWTTHGEAGVKIWSPDNWKKEVDGDILTVTSPDDEVFIGYIISHEGNLDQTLGALDKELGAVVKDVKFDAKHDEFSIDGMSAWGLNGTGTVEGHAVEIRNELVVTPKGKILIIFGAGTHSGLDKHTADLKKIFEGVKKL